jgi:hypothetical protein
MDWEFRDRYYCIKGRECEITIEPRPGNCDRGNWLADLFPHRNSSVKIGQAEGWPRYYFDLDRAKAACEAWLLKRGQQAP